MSIDWVPIILYVVVVAVGVVPMRLAGLRRETGMFVALVTICLGLYLSNPDFLGQSNVLNASKQISMLGIYAIGIGFVIITGGIDLSIGSIVGLTGVLIAQFTLGDKASTDSSWAIVIDLCLNAVLLLIIAIGWQHIRIGAMVYSSLTAAFTVVVLIAALYARAQWIAVVIRLGPEFIGLGLVLLALRLRRRALFVVGVLIPLLIQYLGVLLVSFAGGQPVLIASMVAVSVAMLIGLGQGCLITGLDLQPFIVTLGGMLALRGVSQTIVKGGTLSLGTGAFRDFANSGLVSPPPVLRHFVLTDVFSASGFHYALQNTLAVLTAYPTLVFLATAVVAGFVLHFTVFGRYVYAIGGNRDAAAYSGIPVKLVETLTYVISAGLAGVAGICYASYIGQMSQQVGIAYELYAIAAAVLGGCSLRGGEGTVIGIIIGSAIMRVIDNGINMFQVLYRDARGFKRIWRLDQNWTFIIIGGVILVAVVLDQVVHIVQARRRTRRAGAAAGSGGAPPSPPGFEPVPVVATAGGKAERVGAAPQAGARESHV